MKITLEVEFLLKAVSDVQGIVERKTLNSILSNVLLIAKDNKLTLSATDMKLYVTKTISANIIEEGATTVPMHQLFDTVRKLKSRDTITLTLTDKHLKLECDGFKGNLPFLPVTDFPDNYKGEFENTFAITSDFLKFIINKTKFAICLDLSRVYLNGIYLHQDKDSDGNRLLKAVATDGHKLAFATAPLPSNAESLKDIIIPRKAVDELYKLMEKIEPCEVLISITNSLIVFNFGDLILSSNLIEGTFPEYNKVIPTTIAHNIVINNKELISAIDIVSTFSEDKMRPVKIHINGNLLTVTAAKDNGLYSGEQNITLSSTYSEFLISFNAKYLLEILHLIETDEVTFNLSTITAPVIINSKGNSNYLFVLMPMRL